MEEKKNKKSTVAIIILTILLVLSLGYIGYDKFFSKNNNITPNEEKNINQDNREEPTTTDKNVGDCYTKDNKKRCVVFKKENIEIEEDESDDSNNYYVNDNFIMEYLDLNSIIVIDKDYFIVRDNFDDSPLVFLNSKGEEKPLDFKNINEIGSVKDASYNNNILSIASYSYIGDYEAALCRDYKDSDIIYIEQEIEYKGNGIFGEPKTTKTKTVAEKIKETYNITCDELKNTNDPDLEYEKQLATGEYQ